jgi:pseudouridine kinase
MLPKNLFTFIAVIKKPVVCVGAALIDECFTSLEKPVQGTSNPSTYFRSSGGVSCNIAHHLSLLGQNVELITHFGNDTDGRWLMERCKLFGIGISNSIVNEKETGRYAAFLSPDGDLFAGAMSGNFETELTIDFLKEKIQLFKSASLLLIDCNLNEKCIGWLTEFSNKENISCIIEPVSVPKAKKIQHVTIKNFLIITPNK